MAWPGTSVPGHPLTTITLDPCASSALPPDAQALIEPAPPATKGGRGRRGQWRVRFAPRWRPVADPLTGWTGGGDPLETIELRFPDLETAMDYCRRQGLAFSIHGTPRRQLPLHVRLPPEPAPVLCCCRQVGSFRQDRTFTNADVNDRLCEGFRALAYESLQCRNSRAPRSGLWVKRLWDGSGG